MRKTARFIGWCGLVLLLNSCSTVSYVVDWDTSRSFTDFRSFAWFERATPGDQTPQTLPNDIVNARIQSSVVAELGRAGLEAAPLDSADLLVTSHVALSHKLVLFNSGWGAYPYYPGWGWGCGWGSGWGRWGWGPSWGGGYTRAITYVEGTLVVDAIDRTSRRLVWRGIAEGAFRKSNPSDSEVAEVVAGLLRGFPPR
jgi:hypothetical protein